MQELTLKLNQIKPYPSNPRDIRPAIEAVKESIRRFGYVVPIVVDKAHVIIAGHTRYQALVELKTKTALVLVSDMSDDLAREWRIVDNRSSEIAQWDRDRLIAELRSIDEDMAPFFDLKELDGLMSDIDKIGSTSVDKGTIDSTRKELTTHFQTLAKNMQKRVMFVNCQHCGKKFGFDIDIKGFGLNIHEAKEIQQPASN
jgi:ParB family transcriptional regulator, chromosome partitioning protein